MRYSLICVAGLLVAVSGFSADWPQFRGSNGSAVSPEGGLPSGFSGTSGLRWKVDVPGRGIGSPVVMGGKVFVTG